MTIAQHALDLEPSPTVPGGGPASRWRPARITSAVAWTWLGLLVACPVVVGTVVLTSRHQGTLTDGGLTTLLVMGMVLLLLLCGIHAAGMAAVESRVDDDMREYGVGVRSVLHLRRGVSGWFAHAPLEVGGRAAGTVERGIGPDGPWTTLVIGDGRWHLSAGAGRYALTPEGADDEPVALARSLGGGRRRDWEIEVDDRLLRLREHPGRTLPRRTLLDDRGRAWLVRTGRRRLEGRLPAELSDLGVACCLLVLAGLAETTARVGGATDSEAGDDAWDEAWDAAGDDWSWSDGGSSDGASGTDSGSSWWDGGWSGGGWSDGTPTDGGWSGGCSSDSGGGWSW